jgi:hypothetical protein
MISLNDAQLKTVMAAAAHVPLEKRAQFLERIAAMLKLRGLGHFADSDVDDGEVGARRIGSRERYEPSIHLLPLLETI